MNKAKWILATLFLALGSAPQTQAEDSAPPMALGKALYRVMKVQATPSGIKETEVCRGQIEFLPSYADQYGEATCASIYGNKRVNVELTVGGLLGRAGPGSWPMRPGQIYLTYYGWLEITGDQNSYPKEFEAEESIASRRLSGNSFIFALRSEKAGRCIYDGNQDCPGNGVKEYFHAVVEVNH